jgi:type I restriction enzyme R subunit
VDRVVAVELDPKATQAQLSAAVEPVADRLLKRYKAAREALRIAKDKQDPTAEQAAQNEINALVLFKRNLGAFLRVYSFLSQIFDYGNTAIEKRSIFFRRLLPLLEFGRDREGVDLSKVTLTHHALKNHGRRDLALGSGADGEDVTLKPMTETGSGEVREKEKALLAAIIAAVNDLFEGELTDDDKLVYVNDVLKTKLLESGILVQQAANNTKEQFAGSPDLDQEVLNAIMDALAAHTVMSKQALDSERVRQGLKDILLGPAQLWEALRSRGQTADSPT